MIYATAATAYIHYPGKIIRVVLFHAVGYKLKSKVVRFR
jgi:hypothetical protein